MAGQEIRPGFLSVLTMPKSDVLIYLLAALLGLSAGMLEIRVGDLLATALWVMLSALIVGFLRPRRPWRWILVIGTFVPLMRLAAYLALSQKPDRAQVWESGLGFLTGTAGAYVGAFARRGLDELFRSS
jgi:multisubunit Na+/H+ antiporter MnhE subunit